IHREELRGDLLGGRDKVTAFAGHVKMREDYVRHTVDLIASQRTPVLLLTFHLPWGFLGLGLVLLALALLLEARGRRAARPGAAAGHSLSRALVCRVGSAGAGSSGHGCFGYLPRSSARTPR